MSKKHLILAALVMAGAVSTYAVQDKRTDKTVMSRQADGTYVVNTTSLAKDVKGFKGATPVRIYIKSNKIVKVEALPNQESPNFFAKVKQGLLAKWNGMKASKAASTQVDGVTGATYSSKAIKENVKRGAAYYLKNK